MGDDVEDRRALLGELAEFFQRLLRRIRLDPEGDPDLFIAVPDLVGEAQEAVQVIKISMCYSATLTPEPPISFGRSFIFGSPSFIRSFVS
jgi:hypothetical protein